MSFVGNKEGPRKSEIILKLGSSYFGISGDALEEDLVDLQEDEAHGDIAPVYVDNEGRHFIIFKAPNGGTQKFYLEENGYYLEGSISTIPFNDNNNDIVPSDNIRSILEKAKKGFAEYLDKALESDRIDKQLYDDAQKHAYANLKRWLVNKHIDSILPRLKEGICNAINNADKDCKLADRRWANIVHAFRQSVCFGTGGIRGMMGFDKESIKRLNEEGIEAPILKGPNTINDLVFLLTSVGVASFGKNQNPRFEKVVIGYDSRIGGFDLAEIVARLFLNEEYTVYFFDAPCPYPEITFAIPHKSIKADIGILISASHNDYRYNGYKLSCCNGSQFDPEERDEMYEKYIATAEFEQIKLLPSFDKAAEGKLWFLGGDKPLPEFDYAGKEEFLIDIHKKHRDHVMSFMLTPDLAERQKSNPLKIGYCAFHGAGHIAVPKLLREVGFTEIKSIKHKGLNDLNGLFPCFNSNLGKEQQPDPGDARAAFLAVEAFKTDYPNEFDNTDIIIGTDPDADRCGVIVKVPENQRFLYPKKYIFETDEETGDEYVVEIPPNERSCNFTEEYMLLSADDAWALVLWYRLQRDIGEDGQVRDVDKKFVVLSHTTSDSIVRLASKYKLGVIKTWVGFAALAAATRDVWDGKTDKITRLVEGRRQDGPEDYIQRQLCHPFVCNCLNMDNKRSINIGAMEQSNGFSILGGPPPDARSLGENGHVRDKDGTFAALLLAEIAAWAKDQSTTLLELLDKHIYLDPDIGLFVNLYEPDPLDGEYPGIEGDRLKKAILRRALGFFQLACSGDLDIGGYHVKSACIYRTGKYDAIYPATYDFQFPDEGVRFFFDEEKMDHVTVRPSGTGNSLRFHVQLHSSPTESDLITEKEKLHKKGREIMDGIRELLKARRY